MPWNPAQYDRFREERSQPFFDLMAMVEPAPGMRVVDLGCGTGALTKKLHVELAASETVGVDSSETMLAKSRESEAPGLRFELGAIESFASEAAYDLVFSNAALHWVDDHEAVFARLTRALRPGGQLAVQMPANFDHPSHTVAADVALEAPFAAAMAGYARKVPVLAPEAYAEMLDRLGYARQNVRLAVYGHKLASTGEVVEWVKGTLLTDYEKRMPPALFAQFVEAYRAKLTATVGARTPYFFAFKRILFWAKR
jgi:trans-aconitate 2-methyltransferase